MGQGIRIRVASHNPSTKTHGRDVKSHRWRSWRVHKMWPFFCKPKRFSTSHNESQHSIVQHSSTIFTIHLFHVSTCLIHEHYVSCWSFIRFRRESSDANPRCLMLWKFGWRLHMQIGDRRDNSDLELPSCRQSRLHWELKLEINYKDFSH